MSDGGGEKRCEKCHGVFPLTGFRVRRSRPDGRAPWCKTCSHKHHVKRFPERVGLKRTRRPDYPHNEKGEKRCCICHGWLPLSEFHKNRKTWDGKNARCKKCHSHYNRCLAPQNPTQRSLRRKYGISQEQYRAIWEKQDHCCLICGNQINQMGSGGDHKTLAHVDHDHQTGRIRGLLCGKCNMALGLLMDKIELLQKCIAYLSEHSGESTD